MFQRFSTEGPVRLGGIITLFDNEYPSGYVFPGEHHDFWECVLVLEGRICVSADSHVFDLGEGEIVFHAPMQLHKFHIEHPTGARLLIASFELTGRAEESLRDLVCPLTDTERRCIDDLLRFLADVAGPREARNAYLPRLRTCMPTVAPFLHRLLFSLIARSPSYAPRRAPESSPFSAAVDYLRTHISEAVRSEELARAVGVSVSGLKRLFRRYADMGVHEYQLHLKCLRALTLLHEGMGVGQVAEQLGFSSQGHFSRVFLQYMGISPSAEKLAGEYKP